MNVSPQIQVRSSSSHSLSGANMVSPNAPGLKTVYEPSILDIDPTDLVDIIAVPGLGSINNLEEDPWREANVGWLSDSNMLPLCVPKSRILQYTYDLSWVGTDSIRQRLPFVADELLRSIISLRKECPLRPLVFIGHCFGGFVIQKAIVLAKLHEKDYPMLSKTFAGVVFLGTPHKDATSQSKPTIIASIAAAVGLGERHTILPVVERDGDFLAELLQDFTRIANIHLVPLFCFFQGFKSEALSQTQTGVSNGESEFLFAVDEQSGTINGFPKVGLSVNHLSMNIFSAPADANYMAVRDQVVNMVEEAKGCVAKRMRMRDSDAPFGGLRDNKKYLDALLVTDPSDDIEIIEHNNGSLLEGSGYWLQMDAEFTQWLQSRRTRVLWIHGDPGKGKTMLAISVVRDTIERIKTEDTNWQPETCAAYFFCDNKDNRRNSSIAILRSLIYQFLQQRPELYIYFQSIYEREGDQLFTSSNAMLSLWTILTNILANIKQAYIIIDALDECDDHSTERLLELLKPVMDGESDFSTSSNANSKDSQVKWLVTSRNLEHISCLLQHTLNVSLERNEDQVQEAIRQFIDKRVHELRELKGYDTSLTEYVRTSLQEKSEGTFLYVSMAYRELSQSSVQVKDTKSILEGLPPGLTPLYQRIMEQILTISNEKLVAQAKAILRSMVLALRPLTMQELAVSIQLPLNQVGNMQRYLASCNSFISQRQDTVHFVHQSVKTYLRSVEAVFSFPAEAYHAEITTSFLDHINLPRAHAQGGHTLPSLLGYFTCHWTHHAKESGEYMPWRAKLDMSLFSPGSLCRQHWLDTYWAENKQEWEKKPTAFTPLHLAAFGGIGRLVSALIDRGDEINEADSNGHTPLIWAAENGQDDVVRLLLEKGADLEARTNDGLTALLWATINGHHQVVCDLVRCGAWICVTDNMGWTPLHHASSHSHSQILITLLAAGADIDAKDICQQTALQRATFCVEIEIVNLLVEKGANISVRDKDGLTLLHLAARDGHMDLVEFWLYHSADLETEDDQGWTPLMHAAWFGHHRIATYLIQNGARVEAKSHDGNTSLHLATWNGHAHVVRALLEQNADPSSGCDRQETPLQQAAWRGHTVICQLLLEAGVDPNASSDAEVTPLHQAAANGYEVVVKILLAAGGDPNAVDINMQTPSARANENNHLALAKLLKSLEIKGVDEEQEEPEATDSSQGDDPSKFAEVDASVCALLKVPQESCISQAHGKPGFSKPTKITALVNGKTRHFFMKSGTIEGMFASEHAALRALHDTVPSICPYSLGHGKFSNSPEYFLLMEFLDVTNRGDSGSADGGGVSLAQKLAKLHTTTAPIPEGYQQPMFGWPLATYCGSTWQNNSFCASWSKFFAENRLLAIIQLIDENHGTDQALRSGVERVVRYVVPQLLRNGHLGDRRGINPVLVHGDLWIGNRAKGKISGWRTAEEVVFDPSACYAHSEYELGIMRMFGGYSAGFFHEYHRLVPKTEPASEYEDRLKLYQLYHYLNHYLIFRGGYKDDAMEIINALTKKFVTSDVGGF